MMCRDWKDDLTAKKHSFSSRCLQFDGASIWWQEQVEELGACRFAYPSLLNHHRFLHRPTPSHPASCWWRCSVSCVGVCGSSKADNELDVDGEWWQCHNHRRARPSQGTKRQRVYSQRPRWALRSADSTRYGSSPTTLSTFDWDWTCAPWRKVKQAEERGKWLKEE